MMVSGMIGYARSAWHESNQDPVSFQVCMTIIDSAGYRFRCVTNKMHHLHVRAIEVDIFGAGEVLLKSTYDKCVKPDGMYDGRPIKDRDVTELVTGALLTRQCSYVLCAPHPYAAA